MGKRYAIIIIVVLISLLTVLGFFLVRNSRIITDPYKAISPGACIIIETADLKSFLNKLADKKGLTGEISEIQDLKDFNNRLNYLVKKINEPSFTDLLANRTATVAVLIPDNYKISLLLSLAIRENVRLNSIRQILVKSGISNFNEDGKIISIPYKTGNLNDTCFITVEKGLFLLSDSKIVLLQSIEQTNIDDDLRSLPGFTEVYKTSGKDEDKLFIVFGNLKELMIKAFVPEKKYLGEQPGRITSIAGGDMYLDSNGLILNGYTMSCDSPGFLNKFRLIPPHELSSYKILPARTGFFVTFAVSEEFITKNIKLAEVTPSGKLAASLKEFTGDEITKAYVDLPGKSINENTLIIYKLKNAALAKQRFLEQLPDTSDFDLFHPDEQTKIRVYRTPFADLINAFIPGISKINVDSCFAFFDNYLITGSSSSTISSILYDNILNNTLANDLVFNDFMSTQPDKASFCLFLKPSKVSDIVGQTFDTNIVKFVEHNFFSFRKIWSLGFQLTPVNNMFYSSLSVRFKDEIIKEIPSEWKTLLDTTAAIRPFFFINHSTKEKEIFVQDHKNNAYLINAAGRILWKVPLNERINGEVYSIDFYGNRKYQLLFAGKNYLHVIDRNGNYIERFPVKLRSPSTSNLSLFDYDKNGNLRLLIAGEDRKIYVYDKSGSLVKGWTPFTTMGTVSGSIYHFAVSGKDYIVATDEKSIYLLDRKGKIRADIKDPAVKAKGSSVKLISSQNPHLECSAEDGSVVQIFFDGTVKKFKLHEFSPDHIFDMADLDNDGAEEYIFFDKGKLYIYNYDRTEMLTRDFGPDAANLLVLKITDSEEKISLFDKRNNLIYLLTKDGEIMKGFPLVGSSLFSAGKLSQINDFNLIVAGDDRFLINYKTNTDNQ